MTMPDANGQDLFRGRSSSERTRFLYELIDQFRIGARYGAKLSGRDFGHSNNSRYEQRMAYEIFANALEDPNTKRLLFDSRQAELFAELVFEDEKVPLEHQRKLHPPFDQFYMEFTDPIYLPVQEPGHETDGLRALLFVRDVDVITIPYLSNPAGDKLLDILAPDIPRGNQTTMQVPLSQLTFFLSTRDPETNERVYVDRTFKYSLDLGHAFLIVDDALDTGSTFGDEANEVMTFDAKKTGKMYFPTMADMDMQTERQYGWWEEWTDLAAGLFSYILSYTMAKSVIIRQEPVSRQVRRRMERKGNPKPWHLVTVEPKFAAAHPVQEGTGRGVSFRFDVIGHLRFGKHKKADGSYSYTHEYVPAHQRGLAHQLYIPKTYKVERGKVVHEAMKSYYGDK